MNELIIQEHLKSPDFVLKTQRQLSKDFAVIGYSFHIGFEDKPETTAHILTQIEHQLNQIHRAAPSILQQLMYQIDLPEKVYVDALSSEDPTRHLAEFILRREAYKVYLRSRF